MHPLVSATYLLVSGAGVTESADYWPRAQIFCEVRVYMRSTAPAADTQVEFHVRLHSTLPTPVRPETPATKRVEGVHEETAD